MMIKHQVEQVFGEENISNLTSPLSGDASVSSSSNKGEPSNTIVYSHQQQYFSQQQQQQQDLSLQELSEQPPAKKKRNLPGNPDPESEVIALSPTTLLAKNRFVCEICNKGFQRDQNLQLHRRGHNLPWKLKQRSKTEVIRKKVYVCPETSCVHHDPSRALGDLTGIKKHFCRKHGEKKWKCEKCSKKYAVQSDWKAHSKVCGTREYRCDCGTLFSRRDSFITHRAFCDALAEETARSIQTHPLLTNTISAVPSNPHFMINMQQQQSLQLINNQQQQQHDNPLHAFPLKREQQHQNYINLPPWLSCPPMDPQSSRIFHQNNNQEQQNPSNNPTMGPTYITQVASPHMSATALLQQAAQMGATMSSSTNRSVQQNQGHVSDNISNNTTTTTTTTSTAGLFGLNLSSRDYQQEIMSSSTPTSTSSGLIVNHGLSSATTPPPPIATTRGHGPGPNTDTETGLGPSSASYFNDIMANSISSSYDDAFGIGDMVKDQSALAFHGGGGKKGGRGGGNDGLTRDFLGLRPLSQNEIFTISGLSNCMTTNSTTATSHHQHDTHKPWQT